MSDLTPEETLEAEYYDESEPYQGRHVPLSSALAAVAAERERIVKLLRGEAASGAIEKRTLFAYAADLIEQAREGDTT